MQASALQMAVVAATIADHGRRPQPTFTLEDAGAGGRGARGVRGVPGVRVTSPAVARTVRRLMIGVVREGTGTSAAIPGVTVAGKTGTAELGMPPGCKSGSEGEAGSGSGESGGDTPQKQAAPANAPPTTLTTPTPGSPPSPPPCTRASWWPCCSPATARAETPPLPWRGRCSRPGCRRPAADLSSSWQTAVGRGGGRASPDLGVQPRMQASDVELGRGRLRGVQRVHQVQDQRPVVKRHDLDLVQQQRALRRDRPPRPCQAPGCGPSQAPRPRGRRRGWSHWGASGGRRCPACP